MVKAVIISFMVNLKENYEKVKKITYTIFFKFNEATKQL